MEIPGNDLAAKNKIVQEKISKNQTIKNNAAQSKKSDPASGRASSSEQIVLSSKAKVIQKAQEVVKNSPNVRTERVDRIKKEIGEGRFSVESDVLAEKILKDIISESVFLK
jgi:negative regulator of flagellin synthesis FlgM